MITTRNHQERKPVIVTTKSGRKLRVVLRTAGQHFGTYAELWEGRKLRATTDVRPYKFEGAAIADAETLASTLY